MSSHLPAGAPLTFGAATAAYQVEGAVTADGRGPSIWDTFTAREGTIRDASDGAVACASYERLDEDLDLLAGLGVGHYRFSVAWPRVQPTGSGAVEPRGLSYYDRLVDGLLERDIAPMATLYHWDLPQPLEDAGGWPERATAERFADYAAIVHDHLGDRVKVWATFNEPWCSAFLGYAAGVHAPGRREPAAAHRAAHHLLLGHGLAANRLHEAGSDGVGIVLNLMPVWPERAEAAVAADGVDAIQNRIWLGPLVDGAYDERLRALAPPLDDSAVVRDGDLALVRGSVDWLGVNYYTPARADTGGANEGGVGLDTSAYPGSRVFGSHPARPSPRWDGRSSRAASRSCSSTCTVVPASRSSSPRTAPPTTTPCAPRMGRSTTRTGPPTCASTSPLSSGRGQRAPTCAPTSPGRCSTTSSGPRATRRSSGWSRSTGSTSTAPPNRRTGGSRTSCMPAGPDSRPNP